MKSLLSIINKLSQNEIDTFRAFLSSHCRKGKNKKLELFNYLVNHTSDTDTNPPNPVEVSRQSVYQLKKRLQEEIYSFIISQDQIKNCNDQLFLEMDCHKKLYCFKILFDKGIQDHAHQILNDVLNVSSKHSLHSLYIEAISLKNTYFPQTQALTKRKIPVNNQIKKLKKSLSRNLYINQYLSESRTSLHESDECFRLKFINELVDFDLAENEFVIDRLIDVNHLFYQKKFNSVYNSLLELVQGDFDILGDANILRLVYIELVKVCICLNDLEGAKKWMSQAELILSKSESFAHIFLELRFIISVRSGDTEKLKEIIDETIHTTEINENEVLTAKWSFYKLFLSFQQKDFKKVIKVANGNPIFLLKSKKWLINVKILEILSIYELEDLDWLYYKIDSVRKILSGTEQKPQRISQIISLLKIHLGGKQLSLSETDDKILEIEKQFPWHPLSNELVNYCKYIKGILRVDTSGLLAGGQ